MKKRTYIIMIVLLLVIVLMIAAMPVRSYPEYRIETIKIHRGDTLSGYAKEYAPSMNWREYSYRVQQLNGMDNGMLYAGDEIVVLKEVVQ